MNRVNYGQVELDLGDETLTLKPTLSAMQKIDGHFGSIREAISQASGLSLSALTIIVAAGSGMGQREAKDLADKIYAAGVLNVAGPVSEYLAVLMNPSGRSADSEDEGEGKP